MRVFGRTVPSLRLRRGRPPKSPDGTMPLMSHLHELRRRLFVATLGILLGTVVALRQDDPVRLRAWSSIAQAGGVVAARGTVGAEQGGAEGLQRVRPFVHPGLAEQVEQVGQG